MRRLLSVVIEIAILAWVAGPIAERAHASVAFVASADALDSNDSLDWGSVGATPNPIHTESVLGNELTISLATSNATVVHQGFGYSGSFPNGTYALYNQFNGDYTIAFGTPVAGFGTTLDDAFQGALNGTIEAFAGSTSLGLFPATANPHTLLYLGVSDTTAEITSVRLHQSSNYFAIGPLALISPVPEPAGRTSLCTAIASLAIAAASRRR